MRTRTVERGTVERRGRRFAEVAVPLEDEGVDLPRDSLADPIASLKLIQRRLLYAGLLGLPLRRRCRLRGGIGARKADSATRAGGRSDRGRPPTSR